MKNKNKTGWLIILPWVIAVVTGIWLIANTSLITRDGPGYIQNAIAFGENPLEIIKGHSFGYPAMLFATFKATSLFGVVQSPLNLAITAQSITLLCLLVAMVLIYKIAKNIVGKENAFWAILILSILPYPMRFGSDVMREWPNMMILAGGLLAVITGAKNRKNNWIWFGLGGLLGGLGYMVRTETAQVVVYGLTWLGFCFFKPQLGLNKKRVILNATIMLGCFAIVVLPYMHTKGQYLPEKLEKLISQNHNEQISIEKTQVVCAGLAGKMSDSFTKVFQRTTENLMYYFFVFFLLGAYIRIKSDKQLITNIEKIIVPAILLFNIIIAVLLYYNSGYMSRRHCLVLSVFCLIYAPIGIRAVAIGLEEKFGRKEKDPNAKFWFLILILTGAALCFPKLTQAKRTDRIGYLNAAKWLNKNTSESAFITVADSRINFYANRNGTEGWEIKDLVRQPDYWVRVFESGKPTENWGQVVAEFSLNGKSSENWVVICKR